MALGADDVVDPADEPLTESLRDELIGVAFESAGSPVPLQDCLDVVADEGRVVMFGADRQAAEQAAALLPVLDLESLISHRFGLDEITAAFDAARSAAGLKVIVYPGRPAMAG